MQADNKPREDKNGGLVQTFKSREMDSNFAVERPLLIGLAFFAGHGEPAPFKDALGKIHQPAGRRCSIGDTPIRYAGRHGRIAPTQTIELRSAKNLRSTGEKSPYRSLRRSAFPGTQNSRGVNLPRRRRIEITICRTQVSAIEFAGWAARNRWLSVFLPSAASCRESL